MQKKFAMPSMEKKFHLEVVGEESGINWVGDFLYRRPNLSERSLIESLKRRLNGDLATIDPDIDSLNEAMAHLRWTLKEYPDWWKDSNFGMSLYDTNVVIEIYNKCVEFEAEWRSRTSGKDPAKVEAKDGSAQAAE